MRKLNPFFRSSVFLLSLALAPSCAGIALALPGAEPGASSGSGTDEVFRGGFIPTVARKLTYTTAGMVADIYLQSVITPSAATWNKASTKISLNYDPTVKDYHSVALIDVAFPKGDDVKVYGLTRPYKAQTALSVLKGDDRDTWVLATVLIYYDNLADDSGSLTSATAINQMRKTMTHEFGHCLSLAHPTAADNKAYPGWKIMAQGKSTTTTLGDYDRAMLKLKWENTKK